MDLISVLIPTHRPGPYLLDAVASAEAQTGVRVEVIVEADPDGTGLSATVNRAAAQAQGGWLTVLPDDDWFVRLDALALLRFAAEDAAAAFSLPVYCNANGTPAVTPPQLAAWAAAHPVVTQASLADGFHAHGAGWLYRRDWWDKAGPWDESLPCCEEWEFHLRLLALGATFAACPVETVAYRIHAAQKSRRGGGIGRRSARRLAVRKMIRAKYATVEV